MEIKEKIWYYLKKNNYHIVNYLKKITNEEVDYSDFYVYLLEKIDIEKYQNGDKHINKLFIEVRRRCQDYYRKMSKSTFLELEFNKHFNFVNGEFSDLSEEDKTILLHCVNNNYRKFLDMSFLKSTKKEYKDKYVRSICNKFDIVFNYKILKQKFIRDFENSEYVDFYYSKSGGLNNLLYGEKNNDNCGGD